MLLSTTKEELQHSLDEKMLILPLSYYFSSLDISATGSLNDLRDKARRYFLRHRKGHQDGHRI